MLCYVLSWYIYSTIWFVRLICKKSRCIVVWEASFHDEIFKMLDHRSVADTMVLNEPHDISLTIGSNSKAQKVLLTSSPSIVGKWCLDVFFQCHPPGGGKGLTVFALLFTEKNVWTVTLCVESPSFDGLSEDLVKEPVTATGPRGGLRGSSYKD